MTEDVWPPPPAVEPPTFPAPVPWYQRWWIIFVCGFIIAEITTLGGTYHPINLALPQVVTSLFAPLPKSAFPLFNQCGLLVGVASWSFIVVRSITKR